MPELRDRYDTAAVSDRISQPPFAELVHRGRRRAHRTRTVRLAGVALVAALAATPLLALPSQDGPGTPAAPPSLDSSLMHLSFLDVDHGIATQGERAACVSSLFVTDDGGLTWSEPRALPEFPGQERVEDVRGCLVTDLLLAAPDMVVIPLDSVEYEYTSMDIEPPATSYLSRDAGRTWEEYEPQIRMADAVPDGVLLDLYCEERLETIESDPTRYGWCAEPLQLSWHDPQTGDRMLLRNNPQAERIYTPVVTDDGSIWVGDDDPSGTYHVSVSQDRGRTWQDVSPPPEADVDVDEASQAAINAADGTVAYFTAGNEPGDPARPSELYRTTDGGETWQPLPSAHQFVDVVSLGVARDGTLLVVDMPVNGPTEDPVEDPVYVNYVSRDGGDTFETTDPPAVLAYQIAGGFYGERYSFAEERVIRAVSEDGVTWREFDLPR